MTFGEQNSLPQSFRLLDQAFDAGINFFDSAEMYGVPHASSRTHSGFSAFFWLFMFIFYLVSIGTLFLSVLGLKGKVKNTLDSGLERGIYPVTVLSLLPRLPLFPALSDVT